MDGPKVGGFGKVGREQKFRQGTAVGMQFAKLVNQN